MKIFLTFLAGVLVGIAGHWYFTQPRGQANLADAESRMREGASHVGRSLSDTFSSENLKDEMARTGKVIREKSQQAGAAIADATANARTTAAVKSKLVQDSGLAAFKIDVDTTEGVVTLSGTVATHEEIARAMKIAWDTEGVHKVVSTLQVKPK